MIHENYIEFVTKKTMLNEPINGIFHLKYIGIIDVCTDRRYWKFSDKFSGGYVGIVWSAKYTFLMNNCYVLHVSQNKGIAVGSQMTILDVLYNTTKQISWLNRQKGKNAG